MKNTIAIGQPDKVSRAERDKQAKQKFFDDLAKAVQIVGKSKLELWEKSKKADVIQFDLPKGYSARDAYWTAILLLDLHYFVNNCPCGQDVVGLDDSNQHYDINFSFESHEDRANFYLLLAYANGFKD